MLRCVFLALCSLLCVCESAKILGVVPTPSYSHQIAFRRIWQELSKRGHDVTVITTHPSNDKSLTNLTEIDTSFLTDLMNKKYKVDETLALMENGALYVIEFLNTVMMDIGLHTLNHPKVVDLINSGEQFDVVLAETFYTEFFAFGQVFNCPVIGIVSMDAPKVMHEYMGNPTHPALYPDGTLPFGPKLTFTERLISTIFQHFGTLYRKYRVYPKKQKVINQHFPTINKTIQEIEANMDMLFVNAHPALQRIRSLSPNTILIGGTTNIEKIKPLPKDLNEFIEKADKGVIYFSLGSNVKSKNLAPDLKQKLLDTFAKLPYRVIWKFETELDNVPENIKIIPWAPQQDILRHPKVKLFITQGGLQSLQEAIIAEKPMIAFPFFGDQAHNARLIQDKGMGKWFNYNNLDRDEFEATIVELIETDQYKASVQKIKRLILDEPIPAIDKAIWWTEYVIRNKGAKHLKNPIVDLPSIAYLQIDVYLVLIIVPLLILSAIFQILKFVVRLFSKKKNKLE